MFFNLRVLTLLKYVSANATVNTLSLRKPFSNIDINKTNSHELEILQRKFHPILF